MGHQQSRLHEGEIVKVTFGLNTVLVTTTKKSVSQEDLRKLREDMVELAEATNRRWYDKLRYPYISKDHDLAFIALLIIRGVLQPPKRQSDIFVGDKVWINTDDDDYWINRIQEYVRAIRFIEATLAEQSKVSKGRK